jgi:tetratricopeptide (TPR) repeat protein
VPSGEHRPAVSALQNPRYYLAFSILLLICAYARSLTFSFIIDDNQLILGDLRIRKFSCLGILFHSNFFAGTTSSGEFYRPLANAWFMLNYALFGLHPWGWHLMSVLLHCAVTLALYVFVSRLFANRLAGACAAMLFAVMPIHAEPVLWLSSAGDELNALFLLLTLIAIDMWISAESPVRRALLLLIALLAFAACLTSKESSTLFPAIFALLLWERTRSLAPARRLSQTSIMLLPLILVDVAFFAVRSRVLGHSHIKLASLSEFFITFPRIAAFYLYKMLWPFYPAEFYNLARSSSVASAWFWIALVVVIAALAAMLYLWRSVPFTRVPLAIIVVPLVPAIAATLFVVDLVHDRYLYLPSVGIAALAGLGFAALMRATPERETVLALLLSIVAIAMAADLAIEGGKWHDDWSLASTSIQLAPDSSEANIYYANMLHGRGHDDLAEPHYRHAIEVYPKNYWALIQLGDVALRHGDTTTAQQDYEQAIQFAADRGTPEGVPYARMAYIAAAQGDPARGIQMVKRALQIDPLIVPLHLQLAQLYEAANDPQSAQQERGRAQALASTDPCH